MRMVKRIVGAACVVVLAAGLARGTQPTEPQNENGIDFAPILNANPGEPISIVVPKGRNVQRGTWNLRDREAVITCEPGSTLVWWSGVDIQIDARGTKGLTVRGCKLEHKLTHKVGWAIGRDAANKSIGAVLFERVSWRGRFTDASLYCVAAENVFAIASIFSSDDPHGVGYFTSKIDEREVGGFTPENKDATNTYPIDALGTTFANYSTKPGGTAIYIGKGTKNATFRGGSFKCEECDAGVVVNGTLQQVDALSLLGVEWERASNKYGYAIRIHGECVGATIIGGLLDGGIASILVTEGAKLEANVQPFRRGDAKANVLVDVGGEFIRSEVVVWE